MCNKYIWLAAVSAIFMTASTSSIASETIKPVAAYQAPLASKVLLTDLANFDNQFLTAVGERGHILRSTDGSHWQQAQVPVQANLSAVMFIDKQHGWAVGHDATILSTSDSGTSWQIQQFLPNLDKPLFDVYFRNQNQGIAVGAYGMFYRTNDGGSTWQPEFHAELLSEDDQDYLLELQETDAQAYAIEQGVILPHFNRVFADGNLLYMVGEAGFAAKSTDFGQTWQRLEAFYNGSMFDIARTPEMNLLAVGLRGHAFRSVDQGNSWQEIALPNHATVNSIVTDAAGHIYLLGNAGSFLISQDDGESFSDHSLADGKAIVSGLVWQDKLILVTEIGIKTINLSELN
ncbi:YCF48-related protein [Rheinheimera salexigens]|uniref:Photosynthesis system II assembly factor Ycf48/Hcf136-like domain-containing protein n=2 Tax=Rheinheimera salexigens TaxID=1628148 RepID=A0A1E7QA16_9GAMM|nr:hypothetical protein BI198_09515 [Rheinheimera salexigens]